MTPLQQLIVVLGCLMGTSFFAGMETGIIAINPLRLRHFMRHGMKRANILNYFRTHPDHLLGTTLVGTNICTVMASVTAASFAQHLLGRWGPMVSGVVMTLTLLICCEYLPKAWFQSNPARRTMRFAPFFRVTGFVLYPIGRVVTSLANALIPSSMRQDKKLGDTLTRDDLYYLTREGEQTGTLTSDERRMIHGVFELTRKKCGDVMVPLEKAVMVSANTTRDDLLSVARSKGFTRLPVYHGSPDQMVGVVHMLDVSSDETSEPRTARDYLRPPQFVPAEMLIEELLPRMRLTRQPIVLVTDEQSKVIGIITLDDVLSEIVGKLT